MHGQHSEDTQEKQHMRSGPTQRSNCTIEADSASVKCFFKAGRKIGVGDTALFQAGNSLPFIGIIRKVRLNEGAVKLSVNWLYRPVDVKLGKGASLEAAPNEIFYSFHKDEISSESLLHPCKVAFLPKGTELPGVSSFVCWRVYDTSNKCLYWLTDQDYTDERQREVNQLLDKTKHEMQATAQSEQPSERGTSDVTSAKLEAANVVAADQGKTKKRERTDGDQTPDPSKHKNVEDYEQKQVPVSFEDFAAMAEKEGGLSNMSYVEQLIQVMAQERGEVGKKPLEAHSRKSLLAGILVATEREDSLLQFVRLGGLRTLDDWLQEAHRGKCGDRSPNESGEGIEELLLSLLRALERLPVDLDALKTCSVGKSVNNLRSHRNHDVQRKARKLVDTWKKRVNAEMKSSDEAKSGSTTWSSKPGLETHATAKSGGIAIESKSSSSVQLAMNGSGPSEDTTGSGYKEHPDSFLSKENSSAKTSGASEVMAVVKEEKSCSSGQSHSNAPSWCGGSGKGAGSEEKAVSGNKTSGTALRSHCKAGSIATLAGHNKEPTGRHKMLSNASLPDKRAGDGTRAENHTTQRLIVRLPNPGRSPAHSTSGGCLLDVGASNNRGSSPTACLLDVGASNNRGSSPSLLDQPESYNESSRAPDIHSPGTSGDTKCGSSIPHITKAGADSKEECDRPCLAVAHDVGNKTLDSKHVSSKTLVMGKCPPVLHMSVSVKGNFPSADSSTPGRSKVIPQGLGIGSVEGIDVLTSIAACKGSENAFNDHLGEEQCPPALTRDHIDSTSKENKEGKEQKELGTSCADYTSLGESMKLACDIEDTIMSTSADMTQDETAIDCTTKVECSGERVVTETTDPLEKRDEAGDGREDGSSEAKVHEHESSFMPPGDIGNGSTVKGECDTGGLDNTAVLQEGSEDGGKGLLRMSSPSRLPSAGANIVDSGLEFYEEDALEVARQVAKEVEQEVEGYGKPDSEEPGSVSPGKVDFEESSQYNRAMAASILLDAGVVEARNVTHMESESPSRVQSLCPKDDVEVMPGSEQTLDPASVKEEAEEEDNKCTMAMVLKESIIPALSPKASPDDGAAVPGDRTCGTKDIAERPVFDLNEGILTDEALHDNHTQATVSALGAVGVVADRTPPLAAPVAVVSATKGAFIPPSNISKPKGELGWKGSAATSAFRPAEPRRMVDVVQSSLDTGAATSENMASLEQNGKQAWMLDIDLNVADERVLEDSRTGFHIVGNGGAAGSRPELDLNRVDESDESMCPVTSVSRGADRLSLTASRSMLDFDLNDGPGSEGGIEEVTSRGKGLDGSGIPVVTALRPNPEFVSAYPWFSSTGDVPAAMVMPATLAASSRPDVSFPVLASTLVKPGHTFNQFVGGQYRAGAPMSSSSLPYHAAIPAVFPPAGFSFGVGFPFTSASYSMNHAPYVTSASSVPFPNMSPAQLMGVGAVVSPFGRPSLPGSIGEVPMGAAEFSSAPWARPSLDLNTGPDMIVGPDTRDDRYGMRPVAGGLSQFPYQQIASTGGSMKRKEPEGGFDSYRSGFTQMAWREL